MNCGSTNPRARWRGGFTMLELLMALAIASVFLSGAYATFAQILKAQKASEARMEALRNGRAALTTLTDEVKTIKKSGDSVLLVGVDGALATGDGIDNDGDGKIDDMQVSGKSADGNTANTGAQDLHAKIGSLYERPMFVGKTDLGDANVDRDVKFGRDVLTFQVTPAAPVADMLGKSITYAISEMDGQPNVLVRETRIRRTNQEDLVSTAPVAFGVLGFDVLYWNPNAQPLNQGWVDNWDSRLANSFPAPKLALPASLYLRLTLAADTRPFETITAGQPVETMIFETIVDVESVIGDSTYPRPTL